MKLHLRSGLVRPWCRAGSTWARGTAFLPDGVVLEGEALAAYLDAESDAFAEGVGVLGGTFAALQTAPVPRAATDAVRSIPLFYAYDADGTLCISDDARGLAEAVGARLDDALAAAEFLLTSFTTGASTLCSAVRQVQAAEIVTFDAAQGAQGERYFYYGAGARLDASESDLVAEGVRLFRAAFDQFLASVADRPLVIPLSGGLDSRLVATMLARGGRTDALCFCYGRSRSAEAQASQRVAEALGLRWTFIPYSAAGWDRWSRSDSFQAFRHMATGLTTIEHEQDWPAVQELKRQGLPNGALFVPGHTGDFLGNAHLPPVTTTHDPHTLAFARHYVLWPAADLDPTLRVALHARLHTILDTLPGEIQSATFEWQSRQAKMLVNSVRVYEHHGFGWRVPLWESRGVLDFWGRVPLPLLRTRRLYDRVLRTLMGDAIYDLPRPSRTPSWAARTWDRLSDRDLGRYGIWLGPRPLLASLARRIGDLYAIDHPVTGPVAEQVVGRWRHLPPQRAQVNALLALSQLDTLSRELG